MFNKNRGEREREKGYPTGRCVARSTNQGPRANKLYDGGGIRARHQGYQMGEMMSTHIVINAVLGVYLLEAASYHEVSNTNNPWGEWAPGSNSSHTCARRLSGKKTASANRPLEKIFELQKTLSERLGLAKMGDMPQP